ncbi:glycoside hydrolase family 38 N-terminal domain-containing protein [Blastopirellula marina]|uniref:Glycoside hydrolase family 38 N-terminal domain-containing protein n=1 Tax=Blastopirellula marina DSM 3645 TaxID=314230 RepID=A3ZL53_9BACT|nr:hypothetical protein [Blastopirellula marina]EAQ82486.1 hypothetical protein DSM3645_08812 [Blastopirellula marina DSM 3645]
MYQEVFILVPCHSFEDFPTHHRGDEAASLLACWSAMWRPELIAATGKMPAWARIDSPPDELEGRLLLIPLVSEQEMQAGFARRAKESGAKVIRKMVDRDETIAAALEGLEKPANLDEELAADFVALGYCYLQTELLTRQMRYSSNLDEVYFGEKLVAAAQSAVIGEAEASRVLLQTCFDVLAEERNSFYPVDSYFLDLTLCASTTLGALASELQNAQPCNLVASGEVISLLAQSHPETASQLRDLLKAKKCGLVGGEFREGPLPLYDPETLLANFHDGLAAYEKHLGHRPIVYGRRRFGLSSFLPQVLKSLGFHGAIHATMDDGKFTHSSQTKVSWQGNDGCKIDAIARPPLDASTADSFIALFQRLSEAMDSDHVATVCFAHWPGRVSPWYEDLRRIARYSKGLGSFLTIERYFSETELPPYHDAFKDARYNSPYHKQAIIRRQNGPISTHRDRAVENAKYDAASNVEALTALITGHAGPKHDPHRSWTEPAEGKSEANSADAIVAGAMNDFAAKLPRRSDPPTPSLLVANPFSYTTTTGDDTAQLSSLPGGKAVLIAAEDKSGRHAVWETPSCGYAWLPDGGSAPSGKTQTMIKDGVLRNEYMEVHFDPITGALQSIYDYKSRGNRLSQQLALRLPGERPPTGGQYVDPDETAIYSMMAADSIDVISNTAAKGQIKIVGRLLNTAGHTLAQYEQVYTLWRSSRVLQVDIDLTPHEEPKAEPWNSYFCARFAWSDGSAFLYRDQHWQRRRVDSKRIEAPNYVEIENGKTHTQVLTGGVPFHQHVRGRMLDTILIPRGETARTFRLGIGIDLPYPLQEARRLTYNPPPRVENAPSPTPGDTSWALHIDAKNVVITALIPLTKGEQVVGFSVRLLETEGRAAKGNLRCFRNVGRAILTEFNGESTGAAKTSEDRVQFDLHPEEWRQIDVYWEEEAKG